MKSVKEIRDFNDKYRYMAINPQNTQNLNQFVFDVLIGITEHLETQEKPRGVWGRQVDPEVQEVMDRLAAAEARQKKITEHLEAQPVRSDDTIRREAMIKALRWIREITVGGAAYVSLVDWIDEAITRLENGGDL